MRLVILAALLAATTAAAQTREEPVQLATAGGAVHGTLLVPAGPGPHPVALLIAGSGPTDRDGNSAGLGRNDSLRKLAEALAERGVASLRYDKRGIAASASAASAEADMRFDTLIGDAAGWIRLLRADRRFSTLGVVGHSEGSLIGMVAARLESADRYVSLAGGGRPAGQILRDQLRPQLPPQLFAQADSVLLSLEAGHTRADAPPVLAMLFRPSVQPYLISWLRYDPAAEIARLTIPALVVQGSTDIQVGVSEAETLGRAQPAARVLVIEGMNHVLKAVPADRPRQIASYSDPTLPLAPRLAEEIAAFLR